MNNLVSIVIRTWNREKDLKETLEALKDEEYSPLEIIIVDNGSIDNTVSMVSTAFPEVIIIRLEKNLGAAATNKGIEVARGNYFLLLDSDAFPVSGSIKAAVRKFEVNPRLGIAAFRIINYYTGIPQAQRSEKRLWGDRGQGILVKDFPGGGAMIRSSVVKRVGGFPEDFFMVGEEGDLAMRAIAAGYEIRLFEDLVVVHRVSPHGRLPSGKKVYHEIRNLIWIFWKYSPVMSALLKSVYSIFFLGAKAVKGQNLNFFKKGVVDGFAMLPHIFRQRQIVHTQTLRYMAFSFIRESFQKRRDKC